MLEIKTTNPLAALICGGAVDIADIGVALGTSRCLVLVTAVKAWPLLLADFKTVECAHAAEMAFRLGLVTKEQAKTEGKIIGSFFADPIPEDYTSPWAFGCDPATSCRVVSPIFLDTPQDALKRLTFNEARTGYSVMRPAVTVSGEEFILPLCKDYFRMANEGTEFTIPVTEDFVWQLFSNESLEQYKTLTLLSNGCSKSFVYEPDNAIIYKSDSLMRPVGVFSNMQGREISLPYFHFVLRTQLF